MSVREEQPPGTEVVRVKAVDADNGENSTITYSILKGRDSDGYGIFTIDSTSGVIRTRTVLDHEEKTIYRLAVVAMDGGKKPKQTIRMLRVEVLDLNDNRPTFTSSSLVFRIREDVKIGHVVGSVTTTGNSDNENAIPDSGGGHVTYTLSSLMPENVVDAFEIDRNTGSLVVARKLDRETQSEYKLEVRALDVSAMNNPQSSAVTVRVDIADVNDNAPYWPQDPMTITLPEKTEVGVSIYNFTAKDVDAGNNGELRYSLVKQFPTPDVFAVDALTGTLTLLKPLDFETLQECTVIVKATDQSTNLTERLSTTATARIVLTDSNDNSPKFILPQNPNVFFSESTTIGMMVVRVVAVDEDSGDNGRITYVISGGEMKQFALGYDNGIVTLAKPLEYSDKPKSYTLNITASDHGTPTRKANLVLKLTTQGSTENPPRFLNSVYYATVQENAPLDTSVVKVSARSTVVDEGILFRT